MQPRAVPPLAAAALLLSLPSARAKARVADHEALNSLFQLLGGAYWTRNDGWPDGGDPCEIRHKWHGVGCIDPCDIYRDGPSCAFGRITALTLRDNNLTGSITNWTGIGDLHNLSWIDLSMNAISGSLPAEIGEVRNVEVINLAFNSLEGNLPTTLGQLNSQLNPPGAFAINELSLEHNQFSGPLPSELGMLTRLRMLNVGFNNFDGAIPAALTNLTDLQVLYLSSNQLGGTLPESLGELTSLRFLNASQNNISGTVPPSVGALTKLNDLSMFRNRVSGSLPTELGRIAPLRHLRLQNNKLDGHLTDFETLGDLRQLITLDLYENQMTGDVPASLQNLTSLQYLYLDNVHYTPLRQKYCRQRLPNNGKYNYWIVREEYRQMTSVVCEDMHDDVYAFNSLQTSKVYDD